MKRWMYKVIAVISLMLAVAGILLPGLPATEFILLAAWASAKGSPTIHAWIMSNQFCRQAIENWQNGRAISRKNKKLSAVSMGCCLALLLILQVHYAWVLLAVVGMGIGCYFIWSAPDEAQLEKNVAEAPAMETAIDDTAEIEPQQRKCKQSPDV